MDNNITPNVMKLDLHYLIESKEVPEETKILAEEMLVNTYSTTGFVLSILSDSRLDETINTLDLFLKSEDNDPDISQFIILIRLIAQAEGVEFDTESVSNTVSAIKNYLKYCISEKLYRNGLSKYDSRTVSIFDLSIITPSNPDYTLH